MEYNKLDNPVWNSLNETHQKFAINYDGLKFYDPAYCPFGGFTKRENTAEGIDDYSTRTNPFFVVGEEPLFSNKLALNKNLVCKQMVLEKRIPITLTASIVELKSNQQRKELFDLVCLVQPGYFKQNTPELGKYYGIYKENKLIAVTGERMKMNHFTEISAVVTHPAHTRKGYAKQLLKQTTDQIFSEHKIPYLHVTESNVGAIKLYKKLGFYTRRKISFWQLKTT